MTELPQFLHILAAEAEHLVSVNIFLSPDKLHQFEKELVEAYSSDGYSDTAKAWNDQRTEVVREAIERFLLPAGSKWAREWMREEVEEFLSANCGEILEEVRRCNSISWYNILRSCQRINVQPYKAPQMTQGHTPSVLAVSWGKGDPQVDAISLVYLDDNGRLRERIRVDNLADEENKKQLQSLLDRRSPSVIVVGGFTIQTTKLHTRLKELLAGPDSESSQNWGAQTSNGLWGDSQSRPTPSGPSSSSRLDKAYDIPVIYVQDDTARIYQHSKRASQEFSALSLNAKYCVGLARYAQSPLNEYAALGPDIAAITFDEDSQQLVS